MSSPGQPADSAVQGEAWEAVEHVLVFLGSETWWPGMETDRHASFISETQLSYRALGSPVQHRSSQIPPYSALGASRNLAAKARDAAPPHAAWRQGDRLEGQNVLLGLPQTDHCPPIFLLLLTLEKLPCGQF